MLQFAAGRVSRGFKAARFYRERSLASTPLTQHDRIPTVGILREGYSKWERRAPLCPEHVEKLTSMGYRVLVQPSGKRIFPDRAYEAAGATISESMEDAQLIMGVKQPQAEDLLTDRTYMFFSHTVKGQPENMALLDTVLRKGVRLVDYECIRAGGHTDAPRLVAFGRFAGITGMVDSFQALGQKLLSRGLSTPFLNCPTSLQFPSLDAAYAHVADMGTAIRAGGLPSGLGPLVFAFTGTGNVAKGAKEAFELLPHQWITVEQMKEVRKGNAPTDRVYGVQLWDEDLVAKIDGGGFDKAEYRASPEAFEGIFHEKIAPHVDVLVNGMYWDARYPRLLSKDQAAELVRSGEGTPRLCLISDITCDIGGSVEVTGRAASLDKPYYNWDPSVIGRDGTVALTDGVAERGIALQAVDILPAALPKEASKHFGDALMPFVPSLADDCATGGAGDNLAPELRAATVAASGELEKPFRFIEQLRSLRDGSSVAAGAASRSLCLEGHLFDSNLINQVLDVCEAHKVHFSLREVFVMPNIDAANRRHSSAIVDLSADSKKAMDDAVAAVERLAMALPQAEATVSHLQGSGSKDEAAPSGTGAPNAAATATVSDRRGVPSAAHQQHAVVFGAGRVAAPLVERLCAGGRRVTVVSGVAQEVSSICARGNGAAEGVVCSLDSTSFGVGGAMANLVRSADCVISLLPAPMHPPVAELCVAERTDLVTASYCSDAMRGLAADAAGAGVRLLNEMGLDPGMDHMSAARIMDGIRSRGGEVSHFSSVCGGLPAPEAAANPLQYKFSWSPRGVLTAAQNAAQWRASGQVRNVASDDLLAAAEPFDAANLGPLALEVLPNRDSISYEEVYGIAGAATVFRGTLRYKGWSDLMLGFKRLGFLDADATTPATWEAALREACGSASSGDVESFLRKGGVKAPEKVVSAMEWLGMLGAGADAPESGKSVLDEFCALLEHKLVFADGERDLVLMHHDIRGDVGNGASEHHTSSLIVLGDERDTAMARTVGFTAAVGAELLLGGNGADLKPGLLMPTNPAVYEPGLAALEDMGLSFRESCTVIKEAA